MTRLEGQVAHLESTDAIRRWTRRYGAKSAQVEELQSSFRQQSSDLKTARARLGQLDAEQSEIQQQAATLPRPPEALVASVARADAELLSLRCTMQQRQVRVAEWQGRLDRAEARLHAASNLGKRQAQANFRRIREKHCEQIVALHHCGSALVAMVDKNSHVRLSLGSFAEWRSSGARIGLPSSDQSPVAQCRMAEKLLHSIDQHLVAELNGLPRDSHGRLTADVHADLGVHFIVESANALLDARESLASHHNQLRQALGLLQAAGLSG